MKITKSYLREVIKEELERIEEQGLKVGSKAAEKEHILHAIKPGSRSYEALKNIPTKYGILDKAFGYVFWIPVNNNEWSVISHQTNYPFMFHITPGKEKNFNVKTQEALMVKNYKQMIDLYKIQNRNERIELHEEDFQDFNIALA